MERSSRITLFQSPAALLLTSSTEMYAVLSATSITFHKVFSFHLIGGQFSTIPKLSSDMFPVLKVLYLVKLNIVKVFPCFFEGVHVKHLNLSLNKISLIFYGAFDGMMNMKSLSLVSNAITYLKWYFCYKLENLEYLYLADNPLTDIAPSLFAHNPNLVYIVSDWYMVCCVALQTTVHVCEPPDDGISSCRNLLDSIVQLTVIQIQTLAVIIESVAVLILRKLS